MKKNTITLNKSLCKLLLMTLFISSTALCMKTEKDVLQSGLKVGAIGVGVSLTITAYSQKDSKTFNPLLHIAPATFSFCCGFLGGAAYAMIDNANTRSKNRAIDEIKNKKDNNTTPITEKSNRKLTLEQINIE